MQVLECAFCGETLSAANDDELRACVVRHVEAKHPDQDEFDEETASEMVSEKAYSATDS
jgi:predicted small metal-binding protein